MSTLYLQCEFGISGDMLVASLIDLGIDEEKLILDLKSLNLPGTDFEITRKIKSALSVCDFNVKTDEEHDGHDHDMDYLYGHEHHHHHEHSHEHEHEHHHHEHEHEHHHHHHHTGMHEITHIINDSNLTSKAKETALKIFEVLAKAEAAVHGKDISEVHFHEVGAVDSIADICAIAICLDMLKVDRIIVPYIREGYGTVRCQHGVLPIPVPAVAKLSELYGVNLKSKDFEGELVTPTGAAFVAALATDKKLPEEYKILKTGMGCGKRDYNPPSILRAMIIEEEVVSGKDTIIKLETTVDDCTGEALANAMNKLFEAGVRDCYFFPVFMKKNRPGYQINVITTEDNVSIAEEILFKETTTIGIREIPCGRNILPRKEGSVITKLGEVKTKVVTIGDEVRSYPEYESVKALAQTHNISFQEAYQITVAAISKG